MKLIQLFLLAILLNSCDSSTRRHPTDLNNPVLNYKNANVININEPAAVLDTILVEYNFTDPDIQIGKEYGENYEMFGFITDVEVDNQGRIYYLDSQRQVINIFYQNGDFFKSIGGKGAGPGELEHANSISIYDNKWLLIDNFNRIEVYSIGERDIHFSHTVELDKPASNSCIIDNTMFIYSPIIISDYEDKETNSNSFPVIHAYSLPEFSYLDSFGSSYKDEKLPIINQLSFGEVSCDKYTSTVIFKFDRFNYLYGYSAVDGTLKWVSVLDQLEMPIVEESIKGGQIGLAFNSSKNKFRDRINSPVKFQNKISILQIDRRKIFSKGEYSTENEILTFFIDTSTGKLIKIDKKVPTILEVSGNRIISVDEDYKISFIYQ